MNTISNIRKEVYRPWWYRFLRAVSGFVYRFWWLVWLIFIAYIICWILFCFNKNCDNCYNQKQLENRIIEVQKQLDNCCDCKTNKSNILPPNIKPCDYDESISGGKGYKESIHQLGPDPGLVVINYQMKAIPDKMEVYYDNVLVASTKDFVSGAGSISFYYPADLQKETYCKVVMSAPQDGTEWSYHIGCPR